MVITKIDIPCIWGGRLSGILLKKDETTTVTRATIKIIGIHGWLDNLNSLLPLAQKLIERKQNFEIYLYDRAGHGYSDHLPKTMEYSIQNHLRDLRTIVNTLGWKSQNLAIIGHSFGAVVGMTYAAIYPNEVSCLVVIDGQLQPEAPSESYWKLVGTRIDANLQYYGMPDRKRKSELTFETVIELTKITRPGISDEAAKLLAERSIRLGENATLQFTHDDSLRLQTLSPAHPAMVEDAIKNIEAPVLLIGAEKPQWPRSESSIELLKKYNPNFEIILIDGPHHLHMTHADRVADCIEPYFVKHLVISSPDSIANK